MNFLCDRLTCSILSFNERRGRRLKNWVFCVQKWYEVTSVRRLTVLWISLMRMTWCCGNKPTVGLRVCPGETYTRLRGAGQPCLSCPLCSLLTPSPSALWTSRPLRPGVSGGPQRSATFREEFEASLKKKKKASKLVWTNGQNTVYKLITFGSLVLWPVTERLNNTYVSQWAVQKALWDAGVYIILKVVMGIDIAQSPFTEDF